MEKLRFERLASQVRRRHPPIRPPQRHGGASGERPFSAHAGSHTVYDCHSPPPEIVAEIFESVNFSCAAGKSEVVIDWIMPMLKPGKEFGLLPTLAAGIELRRESDCRLSTTNLQKWTGAGFWTSQSKENEPYRLAITWPPFTPNQRHSPTY